MRIVRPVGGRLADEACAYTYIYKYIYTHDITVVYVDSLTSFVLIIFSGSACI